MEQIHVPAQYDINAQTGGHAVSDIRKITLAIGGFLGGWYRYTVCIEDTLSWQAEHRGQSLPVHFNSLSKEQFLAELEKLHVEAWERHYYDDEEILDGTQWELTIEYGDGQQMLQCDGDNSYPPDFESLLRLLDVPAEL